MPPAFLENKDRGWEGEQGLNTSFQTREGCVWGPVSRKPSRAWELKAGEGAQGGSVLLGSSEEGSAGARLGCLGVAGAVRCRSGPWRTSEPGRMSRAGPCLLSSAVCCTMSTPCSFGSSSGPAAVRPGSWAQLSPALVQPLQVQLSEVPVLPPMVKHQPSVGLQGCSRAGSVPRAPARTNPLSHPSLRRRPRSLWRN